MGSRIPLLDRRRSDDMPFVTTRRRPRVEKNESEVEIKVFRRGLGVRKLLKLDQVGFGHCMSRCRLRSTSYRHFSLRVQPHRVLQCNREFSMNHQRERSACGMEKHKKEQFWGRDGHPWHRCHVYSTQCYPNLSSLIMTSSVAPVQGVTLLMLTNRLTPTWIFISIGWSPL